MIFLVESQRRVPFLIESLCNVCVYIRAHVQAMEHNEDSFRLWMIKSIGHQFIASLWIKFSPVLVGEGNSSAWNFSDKFLPPFSHVCTNYSTKLTERRDSWMQTSVNIKTQWLLGLETTTYFECFCHLLILNGWMIRNTQKYENSTRCFATWRSNISAKIFGLSTMVKRLSQVTLLVQAKFINFLLNYFLLIFMYLTQENAYIIVRL